jgi:hypothetical protein
MLCAHIYLLGLAVNLVMPARAAMQNVSYSEVVSRAA